jgi:hypothetical protein
MTGEQTRKIQLYLTSLSYEDLIWYAAYWVQNLICEN